MPCLMVVDVYLVVLLYSDLLSGRASGPVAVGCSKTGTSRGGDVLVVGGCQCGGTRWKWRHSHSCLLCCLIWAALKI